MQSINWDEQPLGQVTDRELAEALGVSKGAVFRQRKKRGIPPFVKYFPKADVDWNSQPLGKMSDSDLAKQIGLAEKYGEYNARHIVGRHRRKRGIPSFISSGKIGINWDEQPLGKMSDNDLAEILGCTQQAVAEQRRRRGIEPTKRIVLHLPKEGYESIRESFSGSGFKTFGEFLTKVIKGLISGDVK